MKKFDKELYVQHAKRLQAIINVNSTFVPFLNRPDFNSVLKTQLNVLAACEKIFSEEKVDQQLTSKSLVDEFNRLTKGQFVIDSSFKYEDEADLIDSMNYLKTFCSNMFKVNLDDLVGGKKITATDPQIDLRAKPDFGDAGQKINPNFAFAGAMPFGATPYENPYFISRAYAKLSDDMKNGKFYRFKTQPKSVVITKWIVTIFMILAALSLIIGGIFAFIASGLKLQDPDSDDKGTLQSVGAIGSGVMYIILGLFYAYPIYMQMNGLIGKNPNSKFHFKWGYIIAFAVLAAVIVMPDMRITWLLESNLDIEGGQTGTTAYFGFVAWKAMYVISLGLVGAILIPTSIGAILNPKPDIEKVEAKIKEYIDMFSAESTQNPVPPADKQTPVDVKDKPKK